LNEKGGYAQRISLIRYYFHTTPTTFSQFTELWNELIFALQFDGKLKTSEKVKG